jgi:hypothetical protein
MKNKVDFSKMTPEIYQRVLNLRKEINAMKKELTLVRFEDYYEEERDEIDYARMEDNLNKLSKELVDYEI